MKKSRFLAMLNRLRWIKRWALMRNSVSESVMEHSWEVATIAHMLALLREQNKPGSIDVNAVVVAAIYHDSSEVLTGDMPSPVKTYSSGIQQAFKSLENEAEQALLNLLPESMQETMQPFLSHQSIPAEHQQIIKAADLISAYIKCQMERNAGNKEFLTAEAGLAEQIKNYPLAEMEQFIKIFLQGYEYNIDQLLS